MMREPLSQRAHGRWKGILGALGVAGSFLTGKHGPCPMCGGKDRWRFTDYRDSGAWICNQCGHGDGIDLVRRLKGIEEFREVAQLVESVLGEVPRHEPKPQPSKAETVAAMRAVWDRGVPIVTGSFVARYLASRAITLPGFPRALRAGSSPLAMLAKVIDPEGRAVNVHRTFLTADGRKADRDPVKMLMRGTTPSGSAVRLAPPDDGVLGVAEGIETALAARVLFGVPVWAALHAEGVAAFRPPEGVRKLVVYGDHDANYHGQSAAMAGARAVAAKGIEVDVRIPDSVGDWNDVLAELRGGGAVHATVAGMEPA